mgnify:CR=1 FL=1
MRYIMLEQFVNIAIILYNIPRVVIGENTTLMGAENLLSCNGVELVVLNDMRCRDLFLKFAYFIAYKGTTFFSIVQTLCQKLIHFS